MVICGMTNGSEVAPAPETARAIRDRISHSSGPSGSTTGGL